MQPTRDSSTRRRQIADLALDLFLEKGFAGTSMSAVAARADIRKATLYHHFSSKQELFVAAISADRDGHMDRLRALAEDTGSDHHAKLDTALGIMFDAIVLSPVGKLNTVIAETSRLIPSVARAFHDGFIVKFEDALDRIYTAGLRDGAFRPMDPRDLHQIVAGPLINTALCNAMFAALPDLSHKWDRPDGRADYRRMVMDLLTA